MEKLISVIVPVYNVEEYVEKCVLSIINQTYKNLEIILVDDGSTDNSGKICDEIAIKDNRIKVIHKKNGGLSDARNVGIDIAKGDYLGFVDSDDFLHPQHYEILIKDALKYDAGISECRFVRETIQSYESFCNKILSYESKLCSSHDALMDLYASKENFHIMAWAKIYKRDLFKDIRFPKGRLHEDMPIMYKLYELAGKLSVTNAKLYYVSERVGSITRCQYNRFRIECWFEHYIQTFEYYKSSNNNEIMNSVKAGYIQDMPPYWLMCYSAHDKVMMKKLIREYRKFFKLNVLRLINKKLRIKAILNYFSPNIVIFLKKIKRKIKYIKTLISGYFMNKAKYDEYDENTIFIYGVPEHGNIGDQAIAAAEVNYISDLFPNRKIVLIPEYECHRNLISLKLLTNKRHNLCIIHGGGNMGILYPFQESIRLLAVKQLKKAKIIIFPQSIDYSEESKALQKARNIYQSHKNLVIFTREKYSELIREKIFPNCEGYLVPDIVLSYKPDILDAERNGILFCLRHDKEKNSEAGNLIKAITEASEKYEKNIKYIDTYSRDYANKYEFQLEGLNKLWSEFKKSELVITDRLHGMIFSVITGTPCIALNNSTGKVGNLYNTWLKDSNVVFVSDSRDINNVVEMIKNKKFKRINFNIEEFRQNFSKLAEVLKRFE